MLRLIILLNVIFSFFIIPDYSFAKSPDNVLLIGVKQAPPFAIKNDDGTWRGISIDLWRSIAEDLKLRYEFQQSTDVSGLMNRLEKKEIDAAIGALTVTLERELFADFSHPFYSTGLGIATNTESGSIFAAIKGLFSWQLLQAITALGLLLLIMGVIIWLLEHKKNKQQFGGSAIKGIGNGFWWSAVTMTTVGYGDKAPVTFSGRAFATAWMFASIIAISGFTAAIASAITIQSLSGAVSGPEDLPQAKVATIDGSASVAYLREKNISFNGYNSIEAALKALNEGKLDAVVHDAPLMQYLVNKNGYKNLDVLGEMLQKQDYAIALKAGSNLRESINRSLLKITYSPRWSEITFEYLGENQK